MKKRSPQRLSRLARIRAQRNHLDAMGRLLARLDGICGRMASRLSVKSALSVVLVFCASCTFALSPVLRWDVDVENPKPKDWPLRRGGTAIFQPTFRTSTGAAHNLTNATAVYLYYTPANPATNATHYVATGLVVSAASGIVQIPWATANEAVGREYAYEVAVVNSSQALVRAYGRLFLDPGVGDSSAPVSPGSAWTLDWSVVTETGTPPYGTGAVSKAYVDAQDVITSNGVVAKVGTMGFLTAEADNLATVTARGGATPDPISLGGLGTIGGQLDLYSGAASDAPFRVTWWIPTDYQSYVTNWTWTTPGNKGKLSLYRNTDVEDFSVDHTGLVTVVHNLAVGGTISEGGSLLSAKYAGRVFYDSFTILVTNNVAWSLCWGPNRDEAVTLGSLRAYVNAGTATVHVIEAPSNTTWGAWTTNATLVATPTGSYSTTFSDPTIAAGNWYGVLQGPAHAAASNVTLTVKGVW